MPQWTWPEIADRRLHIFHDLRWPRGFRCACGRADARLRTADQRVVYVCACGRRTALTAETMLAATHLPLVTWWRASMLFARLGRRLTVRRMKEHLGTTHKAAWRVLDVLYTARETFIRSPLSGEVGMEVLYVPWAGQQIAVAALSVLASENRRIRYTYLPDRAPKAVARLLADQVAAGSNVRYGRSALSIVRQGPKHFGPDPAFWSGIDRLDWARRLVRHLDPSPGRPRPLQAFLDDAAFDEFRPSVVRARLLIRTLVIETCTEREQLSPKDKLFP